MSSASSSGPLEQVVVTGNSDAFVQNVTVGQHTFRVEVLPMRRAVIISAALALLVGILAAKVMLNPLRRSEDGIQKWLVAQTPLGCSRQEVLRVVARRGWKMHPEYRGRFINRSVPVGGFGAELGTSLGVLDTKVDAYWKFDVSDQLVKVYVSRVPELSSAFSPFRVARRALGRRPADASR